MCIFKADLEDETYPLSTCSRVWITDLILININAEENARLMRVIRATVLFDQAGGKTKK